MLSQLNNGSGDSRVVFKIKVGHSAGLNAIEGISVIETTRHNFFKTCASNFKGQPYMQSHEGAKHLKLCDKHGGIHETPSERAHCRIQRTGQ
jgi:hypothetical protein